jgi:hypothetical protein
MIMKKNFLLSLTILTFSLTSPVFSMEDEEKDEHHASTLLPYTELGSLIGLEEAKKNEIVQTTEGRFKRNSLEQVEEVLNFLKRPLWPGSKEINYDVLAHTLYDTYGDQLYIKFYEGSGPVKNPEWPEKEPEWLEGGFVSHEVGFTKLKDDNQAL